MIASQPLRLCSFALMVCLTVQVSLGVEKHITKLDKDLINYANRGDLAQVTELLKQGAKINAVNEFGQSAFFLSARSGKLDVVKFLLEHGADANVVSNDGTTTLEAASGRPSKEMIEFLLAADVKPTGKALAQASWIGKQDQVELLLEAGVPPEEGLPSAAQGRHVKIVKLLLDKGADVNFKTATGGYTALHAGALQGGPEVVKALLAAQADPHITDGQGKTALHRAVTGDSNPEVVNLLLEAGAKPNIADNEGVTPLREAGMRGGGPVYQMLLAANGGKESRELPKQTAGKLDDESTQSLIDSLSKDDYKIRQAAELALLARGKEILPELAKALDTEEQFGRLTPLLVKMGPDAESLIPQLVSKLSDKKYVFGVSIGLERIKPGTIASLPEETRTKAASALYDAILDPANADLAGFFLQLLPSYGKAATPFMLKLMESEQPGLRAASAKFLAFAPVHDASMEKKLIQTLQEDPDLRVRAGAARALQNPKYHSQKSKQALIETLVSVSAERREGASSFVSSASYALASYGKDVVNELVPILEKNQEMDRIWIVGVWKSLPPDAALDLANLLDHDNKNVVIAATIALRRLGPLANSELRKQLSSDNENSRRNAAEILSGVRQADDELISELLNQAATNRNSITTQVAAARAALMLDNEKARQSEVVLSLIPELIVMLQDQSFLQQSKAIETLGLIGLAAKEAVPLLQERAKRNLGVAGADADGINYLPVREAAKKALELIEAEKSANNSERGN